MAPGADLGILFRVDIFCLLISNFNIYNTKKKDQKLTHHKL